MAGNENEELFEALAAQARPERAGVAAPRLRTAERRQVEWRPVSLEELVADDHRVRAVWGFVEGLDLSALLGPIKSIEGRRVTRRRIRAFYWPCGFSQRLRAWRVRGRWRVFAASILPTDGFAAE